MQNKSLKPVKPSLSSLSLITASLHHIHQPHIEKTIQHKSLSPLHSPLSHYFSVFSSFYLFFLKFVWWGCSPSFCQNFFHSLSSPILESQISISKHLFSFPFLPDMKSIMARNPHDSFSFSRRYFNWKKKFVDDEEDDMEEILNFDSLEKEPKSEGPKRSPLHHSLSTGSIKTPRKKLSVMAINKLRAALSIGRARTHFSSGLGTKVVGTLFGHRRGHVHFAFQEDFKLGPAFLVELATPTSVLVKEMASGLVRIALECDKKTEKKGFKLLEEPIWRTYCNGKKCGYAMRRDCGPEEWKVLNAIGPISMGAGVLPGAGNGADPDGEMMYMRAKFERVVGSKDSEAFYMMNPDGNGGPELSIYLLRV